MRFATIACKNLLRRPLRTVFTLLGIATAVGAFVALVGLSRGLENAWIHALLERDTHVFATPKGVVDIMTASIDEDKAVQLQGFPGVRNVSGELVDMVALDSGQMIVVAGWPLDSYLWRSVVLAGGELPGDMRPDGVVLGANAATTLGLGPGDLVRIRDRECMVGGVSRPGGAMKNQAMILALPLLQQINNRPGKVSTLNFQLENPDDRAHVRRIVSALSETHPELTFTETSALADSNQILEIFRAMAWGTSTVAIFIGVIMVINTLLMSVLERTREIGLLAAVGWQPGRILASVLLEGLLLALLGGVFGGLFGLCGLKLMTAAPQIRGLLQPAINGRLLLEVALATLVLGLSGSGYPAWRAIRFRPADALRYD